MSSVTHRQLLVFATIARTASFAAAAELLNTTQPALSMTIKKLEQELGGELFTRSTRRVVLTPEGEALRKRASHLLAEWDQSLNEIQELFNLDRGRLSIAAMPTFASGPLPALLKRFANVNPQVSISVQDVIAEQVVDALLTGRVELGVSFEPANLQGLTFEPLIDDTFVAVLPVAHPLASFDSLQWRQLLEYPHIALHRPSSVRLLTDKMLAAHNLALAPVAEAHQLSTIGPLIEQGVGVSTVPSLSAKQFANADVVIRPLTQPRISRQVGLMYRRGVALSSAAKSMADIILRFYGDNEG